MILARTIGDARAVCRKSVRMDYDLALRRSISPATSCTPHRVSMRFEFTPAIWTGYANKCQATDSWTRTTGWSDF